MMRTPKDPRKNRRWKSRQKDRARKVRQARSKTQGNPQDVSQEVNQGVRDEMKKNDRGAQEEVKKNNREVKKEANLEVRVDREADRGLKA